MTSMRIARPNDILITGRGTANENYYVVLDSTMEHWFHSLHIKGPNLKPGQIMYRGGPRAMVVIGSDYDFDDTKQFRMITVDGKTEGILLDRDELKEGTDHNDSGC